MFKFFRNRFFKKKIFLVHAFTLIEVMVAMLVLAIGLLGLAGITVVVLRSNTLSQQISDATNIATDLMEALKRQPTTTLSTYSCDNTTGHSLGSTGSCPIIENSGLMGSTEYYPCSETNANTKGIGGILKYASGGTDNATFDTVYSTLGGQGSSFAGSAKVCQQGTYSFAQREYLRYYRITTSGSDVKLYVVVLWKDRFGKWRNIRLTTTKSS